MFKSIRGILYFSFIIVGISLFLVILLGVRQYQVSSRYEETVELSTRVLFSFVTIREQITESLIGRNFDQVKDVVPDIETLNQSISRLYDSEAIPGEYKLAMADKIDLTGLVLSIRTLESSENRSEASLQLNREVRRIAERLIQVDRIITAQIRDSMVGFQLSIIGAMGVLISCASFILIILYRKALKPLLELSAQAETIDLNAEQLVCPAEAGDEIDQLVASINTQWRDIPAIGGGGHEAVDAQILQLSATINETANSLNAIINYAQLMLESSDEETLIEEHRTMLESIIASGERIGASWQRLSRNFNQPA